MLLHCYLRDDAERLCVLRPDQPLVLGRETDFLGLKERLSPGQCRSVSRQHVELRFLRAEARVEVKALGTNAVVLRSTQTGEELNLGKGDPPASLISGDSISLVISDGAGAVRLVVDMDVPCFNFAPSSSARKRKLEEPAVASSSSSSSSPSSSSSASSSASGGDGRPKPWVDDGVEDGEDTDEMDLAALQKEFAEEEDDEGGGDVSPRVTQELDMSIDDEVTSLAERLEKEKKKQKKKEKAKVQAAKEEKPVASSEDIPWDSPRPKSKKRKLDSDSAGSKPACSFGANCYRKNADHRARFSHPDDDEAAAAPKPKEKKPAPAKSTATPAPKPTKAKATTEAKKKAAPSSGLAAQVVGKVVVLTGALMMARKEATAKLKEMGALVGSGVTRNTDIVICGDKAGAKLEKAESCGCEVWTEEKFMQLMNEWENRGSSKNDDNEDEEEEEEEVVKEKAVTKKKAKPAAPVNDDDDDEGEAEAEGGGDDDELGGGGNWGQEGKVKLPKPKNTMEDGETREVESMSGGSKWQIKKCAGDIYYCLCPAWKNQNQPVDRRTCKHLREFLGDEYETVRCGRPASAPIVKAASKKDAPKLLLAHKWEPSVDPTGWWLSEKLDGVRAYWNGKAFISRLGNAFYAPDWFCEALPTNMPLDGELFGGRGKFQITVSVAKSQGSDVRWKNLKFQIFDAPGLNKTFEERLQAINDWFSAHPTDYAKVLKMTRCKGQSHLEAELKRIEQKSGEGVMLRKPKSLYVAGRSTTLLKVKSFHDAEAVVLSYEPGKGKHKGRVGALNCKMANGTRFKVGTGLSDAEREDPPAVGAIITYRFQELTPDGVPRFPSYIGVRHDMDEPRDPVLTSKGTIDC